MIGTILFLSVAFIGSPVLANVEPGNFVDCNSVQPSAELDRKKELIVGCVQACVDSEEGDNLIKCRRSCSIANPKLDEGETLGVKSQLNKINFTPYLESGNLDLAGIAIAHSKSVDLKCANLSARRGNIVNLEGAYLNRADFRGATLEGVNFKNAWLDKSKFKRANLTGASFKNAQAAVALHQFDTSRIKWLKAFSNVLEGEIKDKFDRAIQRIADEKIYPFSWPHSSETAVDFEGAILKNADFSGAKLKWLYLKDAQLQGANLQGADLRWANLEGADLTGANLSCADLRGANFKGATLDNANLQNTDLRAPYKEDINIKISINEEGEASQEVVTIPVSVTTDLTGASLNNVKFKGAKLTKPYIEESPKGELLDENPYYDLLKKLEPSYWVGTVGWEVDESCYTDSGCKGGEDEPSPPTCKMVPGLSNDSL